MCQILVKQEKAPKNPNKRKHTKKRYKQSKPSETAQIPKFDICELSDSTTSDSSLDSD